MPNWKKLITSGSNADLNQINVANAVTASTFTGSLLRLDEGGSGLRLTNVGGFEPQSGVFNIFGNNDVTFGAGGSGASERVLTLVESSRHAKFELAVSASTFSGSFVGDGSALTGLPAGYTDSDNTDHLNSLAVVSGSASQVRTFLNVADGATNYGDTNVKTKLNTESVVSGSATQVRSFLNVEDNADVTDATNVKANLPSGVVSGSQSEARSQLGLGTAATSATGDFAAASHTQAFSTITSTPTTLAGYGITDGYSNSDLPSGVVSGSQSQARSQLGLGTAATAASTDFVAVTGDTITGNLLLNDSVEIRLGTGNDAQLYHNGSHTFLRQSGTGDLYIDQLTDDRDIIFRNDDGSGGITEYFRVDGSSHIVLFTKNPRLADDTQLQIGAGSDLRLLHNGTDSQINNYTGDLYLTNYADDKDIYFSSDDGSGGVTTYFRLDGSQVRTTFSKEALWVDNAKVRLGSGGDLELYHNGTNSIISNTTGDLAFTNYADDKDITFNCDDGSGGVTEYFRLAGASSAIITSKNHSYGDSVKAMFGAGNDMQLYHNGSHSFVTNSQGSLYLRSNNSIQLEDTSGNNMLVATDGGAIELYHNAVEKLATTSGGVDITGDLDVTGTVTANKIVTNVVSQSILLTTGSNIFGDELIDTHEFTGSVDITGSLSVTDGDFTVDNILVSDRITHNGDTDTYINFENNLIDIYTAGIRMATFGGVATVLNEASNDRDFRVESNGNANMLFVDGGNNRVGIGTNTPGAELDVTGKIRLESDSEHQLYHTGSSLIKNSGRDTTLLTGRDLDLYAYDDVNIRAGSSDKITFTAAGSPDLMVLDTNGVTISEYIRHLGDTDTHIRFTDNNIALTAGNNLGLSINANGDAVFNQQLYIADYIYHNGDTDTYLRFQDDVVDLYAGGARFLTAFESTQDVLIVNEGGTDIDFRVESNNNANMLFVDAGNDRVGIKTNTPTSGLHVNTGLIVGGTTYTKATSAYNPGNIALDNGSDDTGGIHFYYGDNTNFGIDVASSKLRFVSNLDESGGAVVAQVDTDGLLEVASGIAHYGDTNNYISFGTDTQTFYTAGTSRLSIASNGIVTLNTGDVRIGQFLYHDGDTDTYLKYDNNTITLNAGGTSNLVAYGSSTVINEGSGDLDFRVESNNNQYMLFVDGGNDRVGIGTSNPQAPLEVQTANTVIAEFNGTGANGGYTQFRSGSTIIGYEGSDYHLISGTPTDQYYTVRGENGLKFAYLSTEYARIDTNGFSVSEYIRHTGDTNTFIRFTGDNIRFNAGGNEYYHMSSANGNVFNEGGVNLDFRVESDTNDHMLFVDAGNDSVSIGTSATDATLHVSGTNDVLLVEGSGSTVFEVVGSEGQLFSITDDLTEEIFSVADISGVPILSVSGSGLVEIDEDLHIVTSLGVGTTPSGTTGEIRATGDITAYHSSDERLKENITPIESPIDKLKQINGVSFDWIPNKEVHSHEGRDVGVIAQEIEKVLPEIVTTRQSGYKAVQYEKIIALLIESNKELVARVEELESKIG